MLCQGYKGSVGVCQHAFMSSIAHLLMALPEMVLLHEVQQLLPIILDSLSQADGELQASSLRLVGSMLSSAPETLVAHAGALVRKLLPLCSPPVRCRCVGMRRCDPPPPPALIQTLPRGVGLKTTQAGMQARLHALRALEAVARLESSKVEGL
jgi:hypothetical protein